MNLEEAKAWAAKEIEHLKDDPIMAALPRVADRRQALQLLLDALSEAQERERILQEQNDAFDAIGADLTARLLAATKAKP